MAYTTRDGLMRIQPVAVSRASLQLGEMNVYNCQLFAGVFSALKSRHIRCRPWVVGFSSHSTGKTKANICVYDRPSEASCSVRRYTTSDLVPAMLAYSRRGLLACECQFYRDATPASSVRES